MPLTERDTRKLINTKQASVEFQGTPSIQGMVDGQIAIKKKSNSQLALYRKQFGKLFHSFMTSDGNQIVEKKLTTNDLEYKHKFIDYRVFMHNFADDIGTSKHYIPWFATDAFEAEESTMDDHSAGFLTPFKMTLHRILIRTDNLTASADVTVTVEKQDDGNQTEDVIATAVYDVSSVGALVNNTTFKLNESDFDNAPTVEAEKVCGLSIQATGGDIVGSESDWWISSLWRVEVEI